MGVGCCASLFSLVRGHHVLAAHSMRRPDQRDHPTHADVQADLPAGEVSASPHGMFPLTLLACKSVMQPTDQTCSYFEFWLDSVAEFGAACRLTSGTPPCCPCSRLYEGSCKQCVISEDLLPNAQKYLNCKNLESHAFCPTF